MLLPSETVIHVQCMGPPKENDNCRRVVLSAEQYTRLVDFIRRSLAGGKSEHIAGYHYNQFDAFYTSDGSYHAFNTRNSWVGQGLAASGVCTGQWTPLPGTVLYYLPDP